MIAGLFPTLIPVTNALPVAAGQQACTLAGLRAQNYPNIQGAAAFSPFCVFLHPGVNDTFRHGWSHTLGTLWGVDAGATLPGNPGTYASNPQTREVFDKALDYGILTSSSDSIGDLQFDFEMPAGTNNVSRIDIFMPPEFTFTAPTQVESVWTDITNDQGYIAVSKLNDYNSIAPGWTQVRIGQSSDLAGRALIWAPPAGGVSNVWHVRLFHVRAPSTAGLYHFKIYARVVTAPPGTTVYQSIGVWNYPIIMVKGELNPAWVEVTVRTHSFNAPPYVSGKVVADGTTPDGRAVQAWGFFSAFDFIGNSATPGAIGGMYRLYLFGLAEGTYTVTAEASGFNPTVTDRFTVLAGQSYHLSIVLINSPFITVTLWSKHGTGAIPWHNLWEMPYGTNDPAAAPSDTALGASGTPASRDVTLNLFDASGNLIGWWASDTVHGVYLQAPWSLGYFATVQKDLGPPNMLLGVHDDNHVIGGFTYGGTVPTHTSYATALVDNCDPMWSWANGAFAAPHIRTYSSTHWDGHVPWTWADYVAGFPNGQYTVEAYVTGYVMDEADAYQRTFAVAGLAINQQIDLRRSNWIEATVHMPVNAQFAGPVTTLTLTAEDANGNERGAATFGVTRAMVVRALGGDERIDGWDASAGTYRGGIVIEGWNALFPNFGWPVYASSTARKPQYKDYGLNPTPSTHSLDAPVELAGNPYTVKLYMSDMGIPWMRVNGTGWYNIVGGDPQTTVALCNSAQPLSFSVVNASLWISLRSTDFEIPAHSKPWTFPGSVVWVDFINDQGKSQAILDPSLYGLIQDTGTNNATIGYVIPGTNRAVFDPGYGVTPFDIDYARGDKDLAAAGLLTSAGLHEHLGVHFYGGDWCGPTTLWNNWYPYEYASLGDYRSTRLPAGQYTYNAYTYSYVMRRAYPVQVPSSGWADIEADLIQGGQVRVNFDFYHENTAVPFNGYVRVEVFNDKEQLVGGSVYGQADPNQFTQVGNGGAYLSYNPFMDNMFVPGPAEGADFGQAFNNQTYTEIANNAPYGTFPSSDRYANGQRALVSASLYSSKYLQFPVVPWPFSGTGLVNRTIPLGTWAAWDGLSFGLDPVTLGVYALQLNPAPPVGGRVEVSPLTKAITENTYPQNFLSRNAYLAGSNRLVMPAGTAQAFDVYGFHWYFGDAARTWAGGYPVTNGAQMSQSWIDSVNGGNYWWGTAQWEYGMPGSVEIPGWAGSGGGLYHVKVWAFDPLGPNNQYERVGWTDDWQMYSMGWDLTNIQLPWGGAVQLWIDMNAMATLKGTVRWFDMFNNLRPLPWAQISATNPDTVTYASGLGSVADGTSDSAGSYIMWLPSGPHDVSVSTSEAPGIWSSSAPTSQASFTIAVTNGWVSDIATQLGQSGTPVPEVPAYLVPLGLFAALAASAWLLRKRNLNVPILMK